MKYVILRRLHCISMKYNFGDLKSILNLKKLEWVLLCIKPIYLMHVHYNLHTISCLEMIETEVLRRLQRYYGDYMWSIILIYSTSVNFKISIVAFQYSHIWFFKCTKTFQVIYNTYQINMLLRRLHIFPDTLDAVAVILSIGITCI